MATLGIEEAAKWKQKRLGSELQLLDPVAILACTHQFPRIIFPGLIVRIKRDAAYHTPSMEVTQN